jgi:hypothetical protein
VSHLPAHPFDPRTGCERQRRVRVPHLVERPLLQLRRVECGVPDSPPEVPKVQVSAARAREDQLGTAADHATVPLYYDNRIPQLQIDNPSFGDDLMAIVEEADLDEGQERQLARALGQQYEVITRDDRLDTVASDIVKHFLGRGFPGKALVVSIDRVTAVRTYDKVQRVWAERIERHEQSLQRGDLTAEQTDLVMHEISFMRKTDMAVVISQSQNEIADMAGRGVDITPHRKGMVDERLEDKFKDPQDPSPGRYCGLAWCFSDGSGFDALPGCARGRHRKPAHGTKRGLAIRPPWR